MGHFGHMVSHAGRLVLMLVLCFGCPISLDGHSSAAPVAASDPLVSFQPLTTHVPPGSLCTLRVVVDHAVDTLSCMEFTVSLDTSYATCTAALEGDLFKRAQFATFFRWQLVKPDTVNAVDCVLGYHSYIIAPGELVSFVFKAKGNGVCRVYFQETRLWDIGRLELSPVKGLRAEIIVGTQTGDGPATLVESSLSNHPNPFKPSTIIEFSLARSAFVTLEVYDVTGREIRTLVSEYQSAGHKKVEWDGRDSRGQPVASGIYFYKISAGDFNETKKMVILK